MLEDFLTAHRAAINKRWYHLVVETYPPEVAKFITREQDRFLNPVGYTLSSELDAIFEQLLQGADWARLSQNLDNVIKLRAVQELLPSKAVSLVFLLKTAIEQELPPSALDEQMLKQLLDLYSRIDTIALLAFDAYMGRRERLYEIRANEALKRSERILDRMNRIYGIQDTETDLAAPKPDDAT